MRILMQPIYSNKCLWKNSQLLLIIGKKILSQYFNPLSKNTHSEEEFLQLKFLELIHNYIYHRYAFNFP